MQSLGDVLSRSPTIPTPTSSSSYDGVLMPSAQQADTMIWLPRTESIRKWVAELEIALPLVKKLTKDEQDRSTVQRELNRWRGLIDRALLRDRIQATRPLGCWCLGCGGDGWRYEGPAPGVMAFYRYCGCAEGMAALERANAMTKTTARARLAETTERARLPRMLAAHTFDSYPVSERTQGVLNRVVIWADGRNEAAGQSLMLWGPASIGKSGLACAALKARMADSLFPARWVEVAPWLAEVRDTNRRDSEWQERDLVGPLERIPLLVLDDLGKERDTDYAVEILFRVVNARHREGRVTIFTSNESPAVIAERLGAWFMDRISEMCGRGYWVIRMDGPSLRTVAR